MLFHEVQFPPTLSFGSVGGPERRTEIVTLVNGFEERNTPWAQSRRRYDAGVGMRSLDDIEALVGFFEARHGQLFGFRWKDWGDHKSCLPSAEVDWRDQVLGEGDGETRDFPLIKTYASGGSAYARRIVKPVVGSVKAGIDDQELIETVDYTVDATTGVVQFFDAPPVETTVYAGYEFDVPVRFDTEIIQTSVASFQAGDIPSVPVVEVRL